MSALPSVWLRQRQIWKWLAAALGGIAFGLGLTSFAIRGLTAQYFDNAAGAGSPALTFRDRTLTLPSADRWYSTSYTVEWSGVIYVPSGGPYRFALTSDDGSTLAIDGAVVVDNSGPHGSQERDGVAWLTRGFHAMRIRYSQLEGDAAFAATWRQEPRESNAEAPLATAWLFPEEPSPLWFTLFQVGDSLTRAASFSWAPVLLLMISVAVLRVGWRRLSAIGRGDRLRHMAERALAVAIECSTMASLAMVAWVAWFGSVDLALGPIRMAVYTLWTPGLVLAASLAIGAWLKTSPHGRFCVPMEWAWQQRWETRVLVNPVRDLVRANRATAIWVTLGVSVVLAALVAAQAWQRGLTGIYFGDSNWKGEPVFSAHDRTLTLRRPVHDFIDEDKPYSIDWRGFIHIDTIGEYEFVLTSIGRTELWIGGQRVIAGEETTALKADRGALRLLPGLHAINVKYSPSPGRRPGFYAAGRRWPFGQTRPPELRELTTALLLPQAPSASALLLLLRASSAIGSAASTIGWLSATIAFLIAFRRLHARIREHHVHIGVLLSMALLYYLAAFSRPAIGNYWGFAALDRLGQWRTIVLFAVITLAVTLYGQYHRALDAASAAILAFVRRTPAIVPAVAILGALLFFLLRNEFVNSDGIMLRWAVPSRATKTGAAVNFDEMWESYLHGWFWYATNHWFGWSVRLSYQVASSMAGGLFLIWAWSYARRLLPQMALPFVLLLLTGGYMQLFFGDVEHYTLVGVVIAAYYLVSLRFLQGAQHLAVPSAVLSLAMTFHLLAGFLLVSLAYLYAVALRKKLYAQIGSGILAFISVFVVTMVLLGKPFAEIYQGQWGASAAREAVQAGAAYLSNPADVQHTSRWAWFAFDAYHWEQYNLLQQMFPANVLLVLLFAGRRIPMDRINLHLLAVCLGMAIFQFNYKALLPVGYDWNLYANAAIPLAILVWRNLLTAENLRYKAEIILAWVLLSSAHSYSWIVGNHHYAP